MYAELFSKKSGYSISPNMSKTDRFCLYKTGPVIWANHGMGVPSLSIMLNEMFKILHYAGISDVTFIRLGTSGGVGIDPGTVVVTNTAINSRLTESYDLDINGITTSFPCLLDQKLANDLYEAGILLNYKVEIGKTLCANDFYEGQMRLDGSFSQGNEDNKFEFLRRLQRLGVKNIEMECTGFAAMTHRVGAKGLFLYIR
jgi:uridine phosphorylase